MALPSASRPSSSAPATRPGDEPPAVAGRPDHVVLERRETLGGGWQDRWDDFQLVSPNGSPSLPGPTVRRRRARRVHAARRHRRDDRPLRRHRRAPVVTGRADVAGRRAFRGTGTHRLHARDDRGPLDAGNVVVATGGFHRPHVPHSRPALPAEDPTRSIPSTTAANRTSRRAASSSSAAARRAASSPRSCRTPAASLPVGRDRPSIPRRYRGRDIFHWLGELAASGPPIRVALPAPDQPPNPRARFDGNPTLSGHKGGHTQTSGRWRRVGDDPPWPHRHGSRARR